MAMKAVCVLKGTSEVTGTVFFEQEVKYVVNPGKIEACISTLAEHIHLAHNSDCLRLALSIR